MASEIDATGRLSVGTEVEKAREAIRAASRKAASVLDRAVSEFLLAEFQGGADERRAGLEKEIERLEYAMREQIETLTAILNSIHQRRHVLRRAVASDGQPPQAEASGAPSPGQPDLAEMTKTLMRWMPQYPGKPGEKADGR